MCGRFNQTATGEEIAEAFGLDENAFIERFMHPDDQQRVQEAWETASGPTMPSRRRPMAVTRGSSKSAWIVRETPTTA